MDVNFSDPLTDNNGYNSVRETRRRNLRLSHVLYGYHDYNPITVPTITPAATEVNDAHVLKWTSNGVTGYTQKPDGNNDICDRQPILSPSARNINLTNLIHGYFNYHSCGDISAVQQAPAVTDESKSKMSNPRDTEFQQPERSEDSFGPLLSGQSSQHDNIHSRSNISEKVCESDKETPASAKTAEEELTIILSSSNTG